MLLEFSSQSPLFLQLAEGLEDAILADTYREGEQVPSTTEMSLSYGINPATALKGVNMLVEAGILYKKRGLGMFVSAGAKQKLQEKRREQFRANYVAPLLREAEKLHIGLQELMELFYEEART